MGERALHPATPPKGPSEYAADSFALQPAEVGESSRPTSQPELLHPNVSLSSALPQPGRVASSHLARCHRCSPRWKRGSREVGSPPRHVRSKQHGLEACLHRHRHDQRQRRVARAPQRRRRGRLRLRYKEVSFLTHLAVAAQWQRHEEEGI